MSTFWDFLKNLEMSKQIVWALRILLVTWFVVSIFVPNSFQSSTKRCTLISKTAYLSSLRTVLHRLLVHYLLVSVSPPACSKEIFLNRTQWKRLRIMRLSQSAPHLLFFPVVVESREWMLVSWNVSATRWQHSRGMPVTSIHQTLTHDYTATTDTHIHTQSS